MLGLWNVHTSHRHSQSKYGHSRLSSRMARALDRLQLSHGKDHSKLIARSFYVPIYSTLIPELPVAVNRSFPLALAWRTSDHRRLSSAMDKDGATTTQQPPPIGLRLLKRADSSRSRISRRWMLEIWRLASRAAPSVSARSNRLPSVEHPDKTRLG